MKKWLTYTEYTPSFSFIRQSFYSADKSSEARSDMRNVSRSLKAVSHILELAKESPEEAVEQLRALETNDLDTLRILKFFSSHFLVLFNTKAYPKGDFNIGAYLINMMKLINEEFFKDFSLVTEDANKMTLEEEELAGTLLVAEGMELSPSGGKANEIDGNEINEEVVVPFEMEIETPNHDDSNQAEVLNESQKSPTNFDDTHASEHLVQNEARDHSAQNDVPDQEINELTENNQDIIDVPQTNGHISDKKEELMEGNGHSNGNHAESNEALEGTVNETIKETEGAKSRKGSTAKDASSNGKNQNVENNSSSKPASNSKNSISESQNISASKSKNSEPIEEKDQKSSPKDKDSKKDKDTLTTSNTEKLSGEKSKKSHPESKDKHKSKEEDRYQSKPRHEDYDKRSNPKDKGKVDAEYSKGRTEKPPKQSEGKPRDYSRERSPRHSSNAVSSKKDNYRETTRNDKPVSKFRKDRDSYSRDSRSPYKKDSDKDRKYDRLESANYKKKDYLAPTNEPKNYKATNTENSNSSKNPKIDQDKPYRNSNDRPKETLKSSLKSDNGSYQPNPRYRDSKKDYNNRDDIYDQSDKDTRNPKRKTYHEDSRYSKPTKDSRYNDRSQENDKYKPRAYNDHREYDNNGYRSKNNEKSYENQKPVKDHSKSKNTEHHKK